MSYFNNKIQKHSRFIMQMLLTGVLSYALNTWIGPQSDYLLAVNLILTSCILYLSYLLIFKKHYQDSLKLILSIFILMIAANHYYSYEEIKKAIPWIDNYNNSKLILILIGLGILTMLLIKLTYWALTEDNPISSTNPETSISNSIFDSEHKMGKNKFSLISAAIVIVIIISVIAVTIGGAVYIIKNTNNIEQINIMKVLGICVGYGGCLIIILLAIIFVCSVMGEFAIATFSRIKSLLELVSHSPNSDTKNSKKVLEYINTPTYIISLIIVLVLLYFSYKFSDFSLDDFYEIVSENNYIAVPLLGLILIATFFAFVQLVQIIINILTHKHLLGINQYIKDISKLIIDTVFGSIQSALQFINFIPDFFDSLHEMVLNKNDKKEIQILKIAAFCFAIISWIATAYGLQNYIFQDASWQATLVSFAIQSILFIFNLKLPYYFGKIPYKKLKAGQGFFLCRLLKNYIFNSRTIFILFYTLILMSSSCFSYVYIANRIYTSTKYIDANMYLDRAYRNALQQTNVYTQEYISYMEYQIGFILEQLQAKLGVNQTKTAETLKTLKQQLSQAKLEYQNCQTDLENAKNIRDAAQKTYDTPNSERYRSAEIHAQELQQLIAAENVVTEKTQLVNQTNQIVEQLKLEISELETSDSELFRNFFIELAQATPNTNTLQSIASQIYEQVIEADDNTQYSNDTITNIKSIMDLIEKYGTVSETKYNSIDIYLEELITDEIILPDGEADFNSQEVKKWTGYWKTKYHKLEQTMNSLPTFSSSNTNKYSTNVINIEILTSYEPDDLLQELDVLQRQYLFDTNALERGLILLTSKFNNLAKFSICFALFLDCSSLLAGIFLYYVEKKE